jgi:hypothetical protein
MTGFLTSVIAAVKLAPTLGLASKRALKPQIRVLCRTIVCLPVVKRLQDVVASVAWHLLLLFATIAGRQDWNLASAA